MILEECPRRFILRVSRGRWGSSRMCVIEKQTGPGEQQEGEENSASKPRFHAQGWNKSFQGTPLTLMYVYIYLCILHVYENSQIQSIAVLVVPLHWFSCYS